MSCLQSFVEAVMVPLLTAGCDIIAPHGQASHGEDSGDVAHMLTSLCGMLMIASPTMNK
jgi:hypothetical protein